MKWKTKKKIYSVNKFHSFYFDDCLKLYFFVSTIIGLGASYFFNFSFFWSVTVIFWFSIMLFTLGPLTLKYFAKRHSYKHFPVLKKIKVINEFTNKTIGKLNGVYGLINEVETACFNEGEHRNLKDTLNKYEAEINHIYEIARNEKQFNDHMKEQAAERADSIIRSLRASIRSDIEHLEEKERLEKEAIAKEWKETYASSKGEGFDDVENKNENICNRKFQK